MQRNNGKQKPAMQRKTWARNIKKSLHTEKKRNRTKSKPKELTGQEICGAQKREESNKGKMHQRSLNL